MNKRIEFIIVQMNLSSSQLADEIGVTRAAVSHLLTGRNKPSLDVVRKILIRFPEISPDWLLTGKGDFYRAGKEKLAENNSLKNILTARQKPQPTLFGDEVSRAVTAINKELPASDSVVKITEEAKREEKPSPGNDKPEAKPMSQQSIEEKREVQTIVMVYSDKTFELFQPSTEDRL